MCACVETHKRGYISICYTWLLIEFYYKSLYTVSSYMITLHYLIFLLAQSFEW